MMMRRGDDRGQEPHYDLWPVRAGGAERITDHSRPQPGSRIPPPPV
jgi:hypothetical protein